MSWGLVYVLCHLHMFFSTRASLLVGGHVQLMSSDHNQGRSRTFSSFAAEIFKTDLSVLGTVCITDLYIYILDAVPPVHVASNHVATDR